MKDLERVVLVISAGDFPRAALTEVIGYCGCKTEWLEPGLEWPLRLRHMVPHVVLADEDARYLEPVMRRNPDTPLVLVTQQGRGRPSIIHSVFRAIRKPISCAPVVFAIERALIFRELAVDCWQRPDLSISQLLGESAQMQQLYRRIDDVATHDKNVLICGERGTGRKRAALEIHRRSARSAGMIHFVDCHVLTAMTYPREVLEPLLQHAHAAGTRNSKDTLFLGEVGALSQSLQSKLLTALRERKATLSDDADPVDLDIRVIASTGDPLEKLAEEGRFLPELLELIGQDQLRVSALRERREDVLFLAADLTDRAAQNPRLHVADLPPETRALLLTYNWPGNARELRSVLAHALALTDGPIGPLDLDLPQPTDAAAFRATLSIVKERDQQRKTDGMSAADAIASAYENPRVIFSP